LKSEHQIVGGGTHNGSIGFRADRGSAKISGSRHCRSRARATRIKAQQIRVPRLSATCTPAIEVDRPDAAEVSPFRQICLAENDGAGLPQPVDDHRVGWDLAAHQRQRPSRRLHVAARVRTLYLIFIMLTLVVPVARATSGDVIFYQDRDTVQRATYYAAAALLVEMGGD